MINELYTLWQSLRKCGISLGEPHKNVKTPGKAEGFIVGIKQDGKPASIEYISAENMHNLWTLRKGQHNSFPYIKLKKPIFDVKFDDPIYKTLENKKTKPKEKMDILVQATKKYVLNEKHDLSVADWTKSQMVKLEGKDQKLSALLDLIKRMPKDEESSKSFLKDLSKLLLGMNVNERTVDLVKTLLIGDRNEKDIVCDASLFLELSDWEKYLCRVASLEMGSLLKKYLPKAVVGSKKDGKSAFGGSGVQMDSYPDPNLPIIGRIYLFSMNKDAPCHNRYGRIGSTIFPASPDEVVAMHGAIEWCIAEARKGKTWKGVPNVKRKQDLLIAYLEEKPQAEIDLASSFASFDTTEEEIGIAVFEKKTAAVCAALRAEQGVKPDSKLNVLVITKVDEGRAQVVLSSSYTVCNIIASNEEWQTAAKNHPHFSLLLPGKKGEKAQMVEPFCPSPAEVMRCFQNQWIKNGLDKRDVPGVPLRHVYELFLGKQREAQQAAQMFLQLALQRVSPLLIGFAGSDHAGNWEIYSIEAKKTVLLGISIMAIVLFKLGIKKEDYMSNAAFNVGRLLAFADGLHAQYCRLQMKRKDKDLPPQLIGNAYLPIALDNPNKAIALLGDRLRIYYAWATKVQGEEYKLVKWIMSEMGKVSAELENVKWPSMADDVAKAQVVLGYLARSKAE